MRGKAAEGGNRSTPGSIAPFFTGEPPILEQSGWARPRNRRYSDDGAPVALEDHAFRACLAALPIQEEANRLPIKWLANATAVHTHWPPLRQGVFGDHVVPRPGRAKFQWSATEFATPHGSDDSRNGAKSPTPATVVRQDIAEGTVVEYSSTSVASRHCARAFLMRRSSKTSSAMCV